MPNPLLVAGAVYILQRLSGTFTRFVWRPTGILDVLENPPPQLLRDHPDVFRFVNFFIAVNEGFAYPLDTKEGQVDLIADLAALGAKGAMLKLGVPLLQRLVGVGATRVLTELGLNLPETLKTFGDLLGGNPQTFLEDLIKGYDKATKTLEEGEPVVLAGLKAVMESAEFTESIASFVSNPSPLAVPGLIKRGFDMVIAMMEFMGVVLPLIPEPREDARFLRERLPDVPAKEITSRWMREVMPAGVPTPRGFDTLNPEVRAALGELAKLPKPRKPPSGRRPPPPTLPEAWQPGPFGPPPPPRGGPAMARRFASLRVPTSSLSYLLKTDQGLTGDLLEKMKWWLLGGGARGGARGAAGGQPWGGGDGSGGPFPGGDLPR